MCHRGASDCTSGGGSADVTGTCDHGGQDEQGRKFGTGWKVGEPARRSTSVLRRICIAATIAMAMPRAGAAGVAFFDGGDALNIYTLTSAGGGLDGTFCDAETPPDGFVLPVQCTQTGLPDDPLAISCLPVAFSVVTNQTLAKRPAQLNYKLPEEQAEKFDTDGCELPGSSLSGQICGQNFLQDTCGLQTMTSKMLVRTYGRCQAPQCVSNPDARVVQSEPDSCHCGDSAQAGSAVGTCECFHWQRYSLKPNRFMTVSEAQLCYEAPLLHGGSEQRCIYLDITVAPSAIVVRHENEDVTQVNATVGQPTKLTVMAEDLNTYQTMSIDLQPSVTSEKPSVELPRQRWLTEGSRCQTRPALSEASMRDRCQATETRAVWRRELTYTPMLSESGMSYNINFQATDSGVSQDALGGTAADFKFRSTLKGTACGPDMASVCPTLPLTFAPEAVSVRVDVQQVLPVFERSTEPGAPAGTPLAGALPDAYPNCPMPTVPIHVFKDSAELELSLSFGPSTDDVAAGLGYMSPEAFGFTSHSSCVQDAKNQHLYRCPKYTSPRSSFSSVSLLHGMALEWTPPLEAAGSVYKICAVAQDNAPSESKRCWTIAVKRCMYCTDSESISHLATRFRTNWLQIWSSNDPEWVTVHAESLTASGLKEKAWAATDYPHELEQGTLVRLGPVYRTRAEHAFEELAERFGTTVSALVEMNPDIAHLADDKAPIPMDQEVCVLPGICTPATGMALDA